MKYYYHDERSGITIYHGRAEQALPGLGKFTAIITDPPYSEKTHSGHDAFANGTQDGYDNSKRNGLNYGFITPDQCREYCALFHAATIGWIVWMTDHTLLPVIREGQQALGRYVFAPLPFFAPGSTVRLNGDGLCSWTTWLMVSRTSAQRSWGTLPGGYVAGAGKAWNDRSCMGGKPTALMGLLIEHYAHCQGPICDPFMGHGTLLVAAKSLGVPAVGIDVDESACEAAALRLSQSVLPFTPAPVERKPELELFKNR